MELLLKTLLLWIHILLFVLNIQHQPTSFLLKESFLRNLPEVLTRLAPYMLFISHFNLCLLVLHDHLHALLSLISWWSVVLCLSRLVRWWPIERVISQACVMCCAVDCLLPWGLHRWASINWLECRQYVLLWLTSLYWDLDRLKHGWLVLHLQAITRWLALLIQVRVVLWLLPDALIGVNDLTLQDLAVLVQSQTIAHGLKVFLLGVLRA